MKKYQLLLVCMMASSVSSYGALNAKIQFFAPATVTEVNSVRIGHQLKIRLTAVDFDLIANKNITCNYVLSVLPKGSNTPITLSGKFAGKWTKLGSNGGEAATTAEMAGAAGTHMTAELVTIPDFMPEGSATLTISFVATNVRTFNISKNIRITL